MSDDAPRGDPGVDPDDLDISKSEYVRELGDDRYVVSPGRRPPPAPRGGDSGDGPDDTDAGNATGDGTGPTATGGPEAGGRDAGDRLPTADDVREGLTPDDRRTPPSTDSATRRSTAAAADPDTPSGGSTEGPAGPAGSDSGLPTDPTAGGDGNDARRGRSATSTAGADRSPERSPDRPASHDRRGAPRGGGGTGGSPADIDAGDVGQWLAASLADSEFAYGFDATLSLDGRTARHRMASDDVGETFETLVTWFASAAGGDTPTEDALGILLAGMDDGPRLPPNAVRAALAGLGLSRDDSVEDLLAALERAGGLRLR